jgi:hypothetical protein
MWLVDQKEGNVFAGGKDDCAGAAKVAGNCSIFLSDVEEELVVDEPVSCYNCRYRRWTAESFACLKPS